MTQSGIEGVIFGEFGNSVGICVLKMAPEVTLPRL